jgi:hypothetical protein
LIPCPQRVFCTAPQAASVGTDSGRSLTRTLPRDRTAPTQEAGWKCSAGRTTASLFSGTLWKCGQAAASSSAVNRRQPAVGHAWGRPIHVQLTQGEHWGHGRIGGFPGNCCTGWTGPPPDLMTEGKLF